ncbi:hypothetical protein KAR91_31445 [Candidatus Pacearchaeota archaeon]|nr:hypothetical protein [Candidatus Pacearchaeota archaeon]
MKSIIKILQPKHIKGTLQARIDFAKVTGKEFHLKPATFLNTETDEFFCNIVGGISYPTATLPGCVIIIGVQNEPEIKFKVIDCIEDQNVFILLQKVVMFREKYGFGTDSRLLPWWYGDQLKFQTLIVKASIALEEKHGINQGLYLKDTVDLREKHSFPLYIRQIFNTLEEKTLDIAQNEILVGYLQGFQREEAEKGKTENFPAIGLLGGMVHSLQIEQPWMQEVDRGRSF